MKYHNWVIAIIFTCASFCTHDAFGQQDPAVNVFNEHNVLSSYNIHDYSFASDPSNILPWPIGASYSQGNQASVQLTSNPGTAGVGQARIGVHFNWYLGNISLSEFASRPVRIRLTYSYSISSTYTEGDGSSNACVGSPQLSPGPWIHSIGRAFGGAGTQSGSNEVLDIATSIGEIETWNRSIWLDLYCQVHTASSASSVHTSSSWVCINNIDVIFEPYQLQRGDLLFCDGNGNYSLVPGAWDHVGIYLGNNKVIESYPIFGMYNNSGVHITDLSDWQYPKRSHVAYGRVVGATNITIENAISFAYTQENKSYNYNLAFKKSGIMDNNWYCSELVWAAYYYAGVDLENIPDAMGMCPEELYKSPNVFIYGGHYEHQLNSKKSIIRVRCPVDIEVVDPDSLIVNKDVINIDGAIYGEDVDHSDGSIFKWIGIPVRKSGTHHVNVTPVSGALPSDTYTLDVMLSDSNSMVLANQELIGSGDNKTYDFEWPNDAADGGGGKHSKCGCIGIECLIAYVIVLYKSKKTVKSDKCVT